MRSATCTSDKISHNKSPLNQDSEQWWHNCSNVLLLHWYRSQRYIDVSLNEDSINVRISAPRRHLPSLQSTGQNMFSSCS